MEGRPKPSSIDEPIFLAGSTRSGTTLLSLMLRQHPDIAFPGELEWAFDRSVDDSAASLEAYYDWLSTNRFFLTHRLEIDPSLSFEGLVRSFLGQMAGGAAKKRFVGASVHRHWGRILDVWPRARFIRLLRDGRDVCASWLRLGWEGNAYRGGHAWRSSMEEWALVRPRIDDARVLDVFFEELVADPEAQLDRICRFIGAAYDDRMLDFHLHSTYGPVKSDEAQKWRRSLSDRQVRLFESVAGSQLEEHGYELSGLPPVRLNNVTELGLDLDARVRQNAARMQFFGPRLWIADHVVRRLPLSSLRKRVQLQMHEITKASLK